MNAGADVFAVRRLDVRMVAAAVALSIGLSIVANFVLFRGGALDSLIAATGGLVGGTLVANLGLLLLVVGGVLVGCAGARLFELGLRRGTLLPAIGLTVAVWVVLNVGALAYAVVAGSELRLVANLTHGAGLRHTLGTLLGQLFGNALYEEILFRGVLLPQCTLWLARGRLPGGRTVWLALLASQMVFALQHIPNRLAFEAWPDAGTAALDLLLLFVAGLFYAVVFVRTGNLLLVVGLHTLSNLPLLLVPAPDFWHPAVMATVLLLLMGFGQRFRRRDHLAA